jgi:hypothetical protein
MMFVLRVEAPRRGGEVYARGPSHNTDARTRLDDHPDDHRRASCIFFMGFRGFVVAKTVPDEQPIGSM